MDNKIIVRNSRVISNCFNIQSEIGEDLLKRKEENVKEFLKFYEDDLFYSNYDKFREFTKKTGIVITRIYESENPYNIFYVDELGIVARFQNDCNITVDEDHVFKNHLVIYIYVDRIIKEHDCIYSITNGEKNLIYQENKEYENSFCDGRSIRYIINHESIEAEKEMDSDNFFSKMKIEEVKQIKEIVPENYFSKIRIAEIKQIECIYPYEDLLILTNGGNLYVNGRLYARNVRELCHLTSYRTYIIYNNEEVEFYTNTLLSGFNNTKCKKALCINRIFIAWLDEKGYLFVTTISGDNSSCDPDYSIDFMLCNIDDFTYVVDYKTKEVSLILTSNNVDILFPLNIYVWK